MRRNTAKRLAALSLSLMLLLALAACGGQSAPAQETKENDGPSDTLRGIYEALIAPDSDYSQTKAMYAEFYPELEYGETLEADRITLSFQANGNKIFTDGAWEFVEDEKWLTAVIAEDDFSGIMNVLYMADAIGSCFGMETEIVSGYLNGLGTLGIDSDNFSMSEDEDAGTITFKLNISGPWDMKELDQMVLNEAILDAEPLTGNYISQGGSVGKIRYLANGSADSYTILFAEYGGLDDVAYQSIVNLVSLRRPAGWEAFLADFTALQDLETDNYIVNLDPDDETIGEIMGERNDKFSYALVRFGSEEYGETEFEPFVPEAEAFADFYFREVAGYQKGVAGASLTEAAAACDVLAFAAGNELWLTDTETLRANMLEAWESLTDDEQAQFDANFPDLNELLYSCFEDWESVRGRFEDAGAADTMEELFEDGTTQWSWDTLSANTWMLGNDG